MTWSTLSVIGAEHLSHRTGTAVRHPIVSDADGHIFFIRDVDESDPAPNTLIPSTQFNEATRAGIWLALVGMRAVRSHLLMLLSSRFHRAIVSTGFRDELEWISLPDGTFVSYVRRQVAAQWRNDCAEHLLRFLERRISQSLSLPSRSVAEDILRQVRYVSDRGTRHRRRMYLLLYAVVDDGRLFAIGDLALRDCGLAATELEAFRSQVSMPRVFDSEEARLSKQPVYVALTLQSIS